MFSASSSEDDEIGVNSKNKNRKFDVVAAAAAAAAKRKHAQAKLAPNALTEAELNAVLAPQPEQPQAQIAAPARTSRYIGKLVARAEERREEARLVEDRRLAAAAPEAEQFVTPAYARALAGEAPATPASSIPHPRRQLPSQPPAKKARPSRFAPKPALRGLRRNDEASIEAYRQRYFEREAARQRQRLARTSAAPG